MHEKPKDAEGGLTLSQEQRVYFDSLSKVDDQDKRSILLTLAGLKPASVINYHVGFRRGTGDQITQHPIPKNEAELAEITKSLEAMGLVVHITWVREYTTPGSNEWSEHNLIAISNNRDLATRLASAFKNENGLGVEENAREIGLLLGFPPTAVEGFINQKNFLAGSEPEEILDEEWMAFCGFTLSREHWRDEIETVKRWAVAIQALHPEFYQHAVAEYKSKRARRKG